MIHAVLYDLGDIFFEAHLWRKWLYRRLKKKAATKKYKTFSEFYYEYESALIKVYEGKRNYRDAFIGFVNKYQIKNQDNFIVEAFNVKEMFERTRKLYTGVYSTIRQLKKCDILNVIITDNELPEQDIRENILEKYKINSFISKIITSNQTKMTKPNPLIFTRALDIFNLNNKQVIFVGHDVDEIEGAKKIGILTVEFNNYLQEPTNADLKISKFREILKLVHKYNNV